MRVKRTRFYMINVHHHPVTGAAPAYATFIAVALERPVT